MGKFIKEKKDDCFLERFAMFHLSIISMDGRCDWSNFEPLGANMFKYVGFG